MEQRRIIYKTISHYIILEKLGEGEILEYHGPLLQQEVIEITLKVCEARAAVEAKGIFHSPAICYAPHHAHSNFFCVIGSYRLD